MFWVFLFPYCINSNTAWGGAPRIGFENKWRRGSRWLLELWLWPQPRSHGCCTPRPLALLPLPPLLPYTFPPTLPLPPTTCCPHCHFPSGTAPILVSFQLRARSTWLLQSQPSHAAVAAAAALNLWSGSRAGAATATTAAVWLGWGWSDHMFCVSGWKRAGARATTGSRWWLGVGGAGSGGANCQVGRHGAGKPKWGTGWEWGAVKGCRHCSGGKHKEAGGSWGKASGERETWHCGKRKMVEGRCQGVQILPGGEPGHTGTGRA